jgi:hypothetical protein
LRLPLALTPPLNWQDIGTSRWQLGDEIYLGTLAWQNCNLHRAIYRCRHKIYAVGDLR